MNTTMKTRLLWVSVGVLMVVWWRSPTVASHPLHALFTEEISTRENVIGEDNFLYGIQPRPQFAAITDFGGRRRRRAVDSAEDQQPAAAAVATSRSDSGRDLTVSATGGYGGYGGSGAYGPTGYTSYGARTGGYGAFSWYTDHPVGGGYGGYHG